MNDSTAPTKTVAITGSHGLIGSHLCDHFRRKGWRVRALDRDITQYPFLEDGIEVYGCDLPDVLDLKSIESADFLIHAAYMTRFTNLAEARRVNEEGTLKLYEAARSTGVKQFVFISSTAARPDARSYYAQSKYKLESMMDRSRDLVVRPGLVLASEGGLFHRIVKQVRRLPVIPVFGGGGQRLNTVHIEDLCKVFEWALETGIRGVITVAESEGITMKELLDAVSRQMGRRRPIIPVPGGPFILLLRALESLRLKLPVSSENLRGLLSMDDTGSGPSREVEQSGIRIRPVRESVRDLIS